jgi:phosphoribosylamine--glycine ligase
MKILVLGSGGREHAICWKIASELKGGRLYACPGNAGIAEIADVVDVRPNDYDGIASFALNERIDITVVGPEAPLAAGIADIFQRKSLKIFGPGKNAARLESSKAWAKEFMMESGIPTGLFYTASDFNEAKKKVESSSYPLVLKYDGLAAGKGVFIARSLSEAIKFVEDVFEKNIFHAEKPRLVIEEFLSGREMSYLILTDGIDFIPLAPARDYKRVFDGDEGPNTGGMGCYSPVPSFTPKLEKLLQEKIVRPTLNGLQKKGIQYCGILYFGIIMTADGPKVLEYNVRFGDPETEVILPRLKSNLIELMEAAISGEVGKIDAVWSKKTAVDVVLASGGYPGQYETGKLITGLDKVSADILIFHSGTRKSEQGIHTAGGRVLNVVATGQTFTGARKKAYDALAKISFESMHYRKDIGMDVALGEVEKHR